MDTSKRIFIEKANKEGILFVRERNESKDHSGHGALEFVLKNGEIFVISGFSFGQGSSQDGLWIDSNAYSSVEVLMRDYEVARLANAADSC